MRMAWEKSAFVLVPGTTVDEVNVTDSFGFSYTVVISALIELRGRSLVVNLVESMLKVVFA